MVQTQILPLSPQKHKTFSRQLSRRQPRFSRRSRLSLLLWGGASVGGGEKAKTLDGGGGRPSNVANAILLQTFCPEGILVARMYDPFSLRGNVNLPFIRCAPLLFKTIS